MQITRIIAIHINKTVVYIIEDTNRNIYRCPLREFLDLMCAPHAQAIDYIEIPHIVWLRSQERGGDDRTALDFAITTILDAPDSVFGGNLLDSMFGLLWKEYNRKDNPQP